MVVTSGYHTCMIAHHYIIVTSFLHHRYIILTSLVHHCVVIINIIVTCMIAHRHRLSVCVCM